MGTLIKLKQLSQEILDLLNKKGEGGGSLEKEIISNTACGAAASGTVFPEGQSFTEFAEKLLRKDITPTISTSFSGAGIKEMGTTVNGTTMVLNITNLGSVTVPIEKINFYDGNTLLNTQTFVKGTAKYTYVYNNTITSNKTFKAELVFNNGKKQSGSGSFTFVYASYYGATALASINDLIASNLAKTFNKNVKTAKGLTWNGITLNDERFCYMYPSSLGALSSIKDGNGFEQINGYVRTTVNLTSPINGNVVQYYVYLLKDATTGKNFTQIYA